MNYTQIHGIFTGGLVALAFDTEEKYLFVNTHSGRGVYDLVSGEKVTRDYAIVYLTNGVIEGIGPLAGKLLKVTEYGLQEELVVVSPSGEYRAVGEADYIRIEKACSE